MKKFSPHERLRIYNRALEVLSKKDDCKWYNNGLCNFIGNAIESIDQQDGKFFRGFNMARDNMYLFPEVFPWYKRLWFIRKRFWYSNTKKGIDKRRRILKAAIHSLERRGYDVKVLWNE